jgi:hypothetical protein
MVLMNPTSIAYSGTSATLGANGQVTFSAVTSLSLNGCFTADFDNYVIVAAGDAPNSDIYTRLRASGTDASGSNYTRQYLQADGTTVSAGRLTSQTALALFFGGNDAGDIMHLYGPYLAQPTAARTFDASTLRSALLYDVAQTHSLSTSYDGFTSYVTSGSMTGAVAVYGIRS